MRRISLSAHGLLTRVTRTRTGLSLFSKPFFSSEPLRCSTRYLSFETFTPTEPAKKQTGEESSGIDVGSEFDSWLRQVSKSVESSTLPLAGLEKSLGQISAQIFGRRQGGFTIGVKLQRPERGNALTSQILLDLKRVFDSIAQHEMINGVCWMPSVGNAFCGGADTFEMSNLGGSRDAEAFIRKISNLCNAIRNTPVPVVALVHGACIGAGLEVAASCDIRVCTEHASFSMPEVRIHLPSVVQARLLCDIIGWGRARHLMLTGCRWEAEEAFQAGLVTKVFPNMTGMMDWAYRYMEQLNAPTVRNEYRAQKQLINGWESQTLDGGIEAGVKCFSDHFSQANLGKNISQQVMIEKRARLHDNPFRSSKSPVDHHEIPNRSAHEIEETKLDEFPMAAAIRRVEGAERAKED